MIKKHIPLLVLTCLLAHQASSQSVNWYHENISTDKPYNIGTDELYESIIKDRNGVPVIVAVIDSGVDIEHEDLDDKIWVNADEIPNNGVDDDNNGYIDDVNGWNFIGGPDGRQVGGDTYELTRAYIELKAKYEHIDPQSLKDKELEEYNLYNEYGARIEGEIKSSKSRYEEYHSAIVIYEEILDYLRDYVGEGDIDKTLVDSLSTDGSRQAQIATNVINVVEGDIGHLPTMDEVQAYLLPEGIYEAQDYFAAKWKYHYNIDLDSRDIVGDNYKDLTNRKYGNQLVEGPDAEHGTHVAGIIGAERDNDQGINGINNNAQIMVLRAVPNGDERDKDVANAIYYAVDNGAKVINMSFGKGLSPNKQYVDDAVRYAEKNDVLLIHASGNASLDVDTEKNFPNDKYLKPKGFLFWKKKKSKNWISVGATSNTNSEKIVASFSNYGKENVDIFAPGEFMYSTVPDSKYKTLQGTSMAAPVVAGVASLLRSYFPNLSASQVKEILLTTATVIDKKVKKPGSEEMVPFYNLSVSGGILNAKNAFIKAAEMNGGRSKKVKNKVNA